jgi:hypothetical protein
LQLTTQAFHPSILFLLLTLQLQKHRLHKTKKQKYGLHNRVTSSSAKRDTFSSLQSSSNEAVAGLDFDDAVDAGFFFDLRFSCDASMDSADITARFILSQFGSRPYVGDSNRPTALPAQK